MKNIKQYILNFATSSKTSSFIKDTVKETVSETVKSSIHTAGWYIIGIILLGFICIGTLIYTAFYLFN
jgi:hypothetical protein